MVDAGGSNIFCPLECFGFANARIMLKAKDNVKAVSALISGELYAQACFYAHQVAELAMKAAMYMLGRQTPTMLQHHNLYQFANAIEASKYSAI
jgi:HEPN domain-containing protein